MRIAYLAGPYRAASPFEIGQNIGRARAVAVWLWRNGYVALCPHLNSAFMDGAAEDRVFLDGDIAMMRRCDLVVLVPGWERSRGTLDEIAVAEAAGIPVYVFDGEGIERAEFEARRAG